MCDSSVQEGLASIFLPALILHEDIQLDSEGAVQITKENGLDRQMNNRQHCNEVN